MELMLQGLSLGGCAEVIMALETGQDRGGVGTSHIALMVCSIPEPIALAGPGCTTASSLPEPSSFRRVLLVIGG